MGVRQVYRGNPALKSVYLVSDLSNGIDTVNSDEVVSSKSMRNLLNVELGEAGIIKKRKGFSKDNLFNEIIRKYYSFKESLDDELSEQFGNLLGVYLLQDSKNVINSLEDYDDLDSFKLSYGVNSNVANLKVEFKVDFLLITHTDDKIRMNVMRWNHDVNKEGISVEFKELADLDYNGLLKRKRITGLRYSDFDSKIYIELSQISESLKGYMEVGYGEDDEPYVKILNTARSEASVGENSTIKGVYHPTPYEVLNFGFNVLADDPLGAISYTEGAKRIYSFHLTAQDNPKMPLNTIPTNGKFRIVAITSGFKEPEDLKIRIYQEGKTEYVDGVPEIKDRNLEFEVSYEMEEGSPLFHYLIDLEIPNDDMIFIELTERVESDYKIDREFETMDDFVKEVNEQRVHMIESVHGGKKYYTLYSNVDVFTGQMYFSERSIDFIPKDSLLEYGQRWTSKRAVVTSCPPRPSGNIPSAGAKCDIVGKIVDTGECRPIELTDDISHLYYVCTDFGSEVKYVGLTHYYKVPLLKRSLDAYDFFKEYPHARDLGLVVPEVIETDAEIKLTKYGYDWDIDKNIPVKVTFINMKEDIVIPKENVVIDNKQPKTWNMGEVISIGTGDDKKYYSFNGSKEINMDAEANVGEAILEKYFYEIQKDEIEPFSPIKFTLNFVSGNEDNLREVESLDITNVSSEIIHDRLVLYKENTIWYSDVFKFNYFPFYNYIILPLKTDDRITKIIYFKGSHIIFTMQEIWKIEGMLGYDDMRVSKVNDVIGCVAPDSVQPQNNTLVFLSNDGLYALKQTMYSHGLENVEKIDTHVDGIIKHKNAYAESFIYRGVYHLHTFDVKGRYVESFKQYFNRYAGASGRYPYTIDVYEIIPELSFKVYNKVYGVYKGDIYLFDKGYRDFTDLYRMEILTPQYTLDYPMHEKKIKNVALKTRSFKETPVEVTVYYGDNVVIEPKTTRYRVNMYGEIEYVAGHSHNFDTVWKELGEFQVGQDQLGGNSYQIHKLLTGGKSESVAIKISQESNGAFEINAISFTFKLGKIRGKI